MVWAAAGADCGKEIYDRKRQDVHAGGSGSGCCAVTLCARILPNLRAGIWKRVLFLPTGALLSPVSFNEGRSVPGIAHGIILEACSLREKKKKKRRAVWNISRRLRWEG